MCAVCSADAEDWQERKGKHFVVYYRNSRNFADKVLYQAEKHYKRITRDLGHTKHDDFWLWDKRVRIYLYADRKEFMQNTGAPAWAAGKADYQKHTIYGVEQSQAFLDSVLPHEMGHLVFRDFIGFEADAPLWLDEGVAQWQDTSNRSRAMSAAARLKENNALMPVSVLTALDIRGVNETGRAVQFYAQAVSLVGFMIQKYGTGRFTQFCRKLRDGNDLDDALKFAYSGRISDTSDLERQWFESLGGDNE